MSRQALGKGLEALIPMQADPETTPSSFSTPKELAIDRIEANPFQPRKDFNPLELQELASSIKEKGIVQPILVRPRLDGSYELIAGERRLRAAKLAGMAYIPVVIRELSDGESLEIALVENLQRADLNSVEAAMAYDQLMRHFHLTQEDVAQRVGKERSSVANTLRLLKLPSGIITLVREGKISEGHARAILSLEDEEQMQRLAEKIVRDGLSVRETERIAQGIQPRKIQKSKLSKKPTIHDPHTQNLQEELRRKLGTQVRVVQRTPKKGKIEIEYYSLDDLDRIIALLG